MEGYTKLNDDSAIKMRISSFAQHLPAMAVVGASSDIYADQQHLKLRV